MPMSVPSVAAVVKQPYPISLVCLWVCGPERDQMLWLSNNRSWWTLCTITLRLGRGGGDTPKVFFWVNGMSGSFWSVGSSWNLMWCLTYGKLLFCREKSYLPDVSHWSLSVWYCKPLVAGSVECSQLCPWYPETNWIKYLNTCSTYNC